MLVLVLVGLAVPVLGVVVLAAGALALGVGLDAAAGVWVPDDALFALADALL